VSTIIRHLGKGEQVKPLEEFAGWPLDPAWVWVAEHEGEVVGALLTTAAHGMFFLWRLKVADDAPQQVAGQLIREACREARALGCRISMTVVDIAKPPEERLARFGEALGSSFIPLERAVCVVTPLDTRFFS
jgi:hypothetical protein